MLPDGIRMAEWLNLPRRPGSDLGKSNFVSGTAKTVNRNERPPH
jgi:hypothetical protein